MKHRWYIDTEEVSKPKYWLISSSSFLLGSPVTRYTLSSFLRAPNVNHQFTCTAKLARPYTSPLWILPHHGPTWPQMTILPRQTNDCRQGKNSWHIDPRKCVPARVEFFKWMELRDTENQFCCWMKTREQSRLEAILTTMWVYVTSVKHMRL